MIKTIALHEFWFTVKRKSYYLVTLGMPLIVLAYIGFVGLIVMASVPSQLSKMSKPVGVIDRSGLLTSEGGPLAEANPGEIVEITSDMPSEIPELEDVPIPLDSMEFLAKHKIMVFEDVEPARAHLQDESIQQVTVIPVDYLKTGKFEVYVDKSELLGSTISNGWLNELLAKRILSTTELKADEIKRIQSMSTSTEFEIGETGEFEKVNKLTKGFSLGIPMAVAGLLILALMMNSGILLASIAEEKENKVMEVIVSSVNADKLLFGKVLGIVMAGVLQISVWMVMVSIIPALSSLMIQDVFEVEINIGQLILGVGFVLLGFIFYGCLLAGMGSLGSNYKDCQQLSVAVILCACVPMMVPMIFFSAPNGIIARILSMVPLFSPVSMMLRLGITDVPWWEVTLSLVILLVSIWFAIKLSARLFRAGTLMQGKRPGIFEIWKVMTQ